MASILYLHVLITEIKLCKKMIYKKWNYLKYNKRFYIYAKPKKFPNIKVDIEYVTRYCDKYAISENRNLNYDDINATFCYNNHQIINIKIYISKKRNYHSLFSLVI